MTGPRPTLMTCPPMAQIIGLFDDRAYRIARMRARKLSPARMCGSFDTKPSTFSEPSIGFPNMPAFTLLLRSARGYVETPSKSRGLMGYSESTINPRDKRPETDGDQRARKGYDQAGGEFPECESSDGSAHRTTL